MGCSSSAVVIEDSQGLVDKPEKKAKFAHAIISTKGRLAAREANSNLKWAKPTPQSAKPAEASPDTQEAQTSTEHSHQSPRGPTLLAGTLQAQLGDSAKDGQHQPPGPMLLGDTDDDSNANRLSYKPGMEWESAAGLLPPLTSGFIDAVRPEEIATDGHVASYGCRDSCGCQACIALDTTGMSDDPHANVTGDRPMTTLLLPCGALKTCCPSARQNSVDEVCFQSHKVLSDDYTAEVAVPDGEPTYYWR